MRYSLIPEDVEATAFFIKHHASCITNARGALGQGGAMTNNDAILQQLIAAETNDIRRIEIQPQEPKEQSKTATQTVDENEDLLATVIQFINCDNVGMVQYDLIHQFIDLGYMVVFFAFSWASSCTRNRTLQAISRTSAKFKRAPK